MHQQSPLRGREGGIIGASSSRGGLVARRLQRPEDTSGCTRKVDDVGRAGGKVPASAAQAAALGLHVLQRRKLRARARIRRVDHVAAVHDLGDAACLEKGDGALEDLETLPRPNRDAVVRIHVLGAADEAKREDG